MNSVTSSPLSASNTAATSAVDPTAASASTGDHLASMRPSIDTANAIGAPTDQAGAASILATGAGYLSGAQQTINRIDDGIAKRTKALEGLAANGGSVDEIQKAGEQIDLLQRLRDRIQLSIERVGDILAGKDRDDIGEGDDLATGGAAEVKRQERQLVLAKADRTADERQQLEQRLQLLSAGVGTALAGPQAVAATYSAGSVQRSA